MSEMELSLFRQRSMEALKQKARRGELFLSVPVGYLKTSHDRIEKDPDRREGEVEACECLDGGEPRHDQGGLDAAIFAQHQFLCEQRHGRSQDTTGHRDPRCHSAADRAGEITAIEAIDVCLMRSTSEETILR